MTNIHAGVTVAIGLALGNFGYQWSQNIPNWETAFERSYFQLIAIIGLVFSLMVARKIRENLS